MFAILQWGHGIAAVETPDAEFPNRLAARLQWGHGSAAVERPVQPAPLLLGLNLQWGHHVAAVETKNSRRTCLLLSNPFNGGTASLPWKQHESQRLSFPNSRSFNGATAS